MLTRTLHGIILLFIASLGGAPPPALAQASPGYGELVTLFRDFRERRSPEAWSAAWDDPEAPYGVAAYDAAVVAARIDAVESVEQRLAAIDHSAWSAAEKADFLAVKAQVAAHRFYLEVSRPWARDPGTYVDPLLRLAFSDMEADHTSMPRIRAGLASVRAIIEAARENLTDGAADYLALARFNMRKLEWRGSWPLLTRRPSGGSNRVARGSSSSSR